MKWKAFNKKDDILHISKINHIIGLNLYWALHLQKNIEANDDEYIPCDFNSYFNSRYLGVKSIRNELKKKYPCEHISDYHVGEHSFRIYFLKAKAKLLAVTPTEKENDKFRRFCEKQKQIYDPDFIVESLKEFTESQLSNLIDSLCVEAPKHKIKDINEYRNHIYDILKSTKCWTKSDHGRQYSKRLSLHSWEKKIVYVGCRNYDIKSAWPTFLATIFNDKRLMERSEGIACTKFGHNIATMGYQLFKRELFDTKEYANMQNVKEASEIKEFLDETPRLLNQQYKNNRIAAQQLAEVCINPKYDDNIDKITGNKLPSFMKEFLEPIKNQILKVIDKKKKINKSHKGSILFYLYSQIESRFMNLLRKECEDTGVEWCLSCHDGMIVNKEVPRELIEKVKQLSPMFKWIELLEKPF